MVVCGIFVDGLKNGGTFCLHMGTYSDGWIGVYIFSETRQRETWYKLHNLLKLGIGVEVKRG